MGIGLNFLLDLLELFLERFASNKNIHLYGRGKLGEQTGVLSITIDDLSPSEAGGMLEKRFGIQTRIGLHCAPLAHKTIGTFPGGTVRLSWGMFTRKGEASRVAKAVDAISHRGGS